MKVIHLTDTRMEDEVAMDIEGPGILQQTVHPILALGRPLVWRRLRAGASPMVPQRCALPAGSSLFPSSDLHEYPGWREELSTVRVILDGQVCAIFGLSDLRKKLMRLGLFPQEIYGEGENFEETRTR